MTLEVRLLVVTSRDNSVWENHEVIFKGFKATEDLKPTTFIPDSSCRKNDSGAGNTSEITGF